VGDLEAKLQVLLAQLASLQAQIAQLPAATSSSATFPVPVAPQTVTPASLSSVQKITAECAELTRTFGIGDTDATSGGDVTRLQQFLHQAYKEFTADNVTGFFGPITEAALKQWQDEHSIVSSGDATSTGWGIVGPKTRAALKKGCIGTSSAPATTSSGVRSASINASLGGGSSLGATITATVNTAGSCSAQTYKLDYGDGTTQEAISVPAGTCAPVVQTFNHQYAAVGTYAVTVTSGSLTIPLELTLTQTLPQLSGQGSSATTTRSCVPASFDSPIIPKLLIGNAFSAGVLTYADTADARVTVTASGTPPGTVFTDQTYSGDTATSTKHQWSLSGVPNTLGIFPFSIDAENSCGGTKSVVQVTVTDGRTCPSYQTPSCASGQTLVPLGTDIVGCNLGYRCAAVNISCPQYTIAACAAGYHSVEDATTYDVNYCLVPHAHCAADGTVSAASSPNANIANALTALEGALKTLINFLGNH
jgi:peptidoglycan hydrolase-like protein with peptidoglycan-binding domain